MLIFTSSVSATEGQMGQTAYAASKAGVEGLALPMARDLSRYGKSRRRIEEEGGFERATKSRSTRN